MLLRPLGRTGLTVSAVCAGGGPLGSMPQNFGYDVPAKRGIDTVIRVLRSPIRFLDTSNSYSGGESERRVGAAVAAAGGLPEDFVLATKVDRDGNGDFSGARVRRSIEESLTRLNLQQVPLLYLHDPEHISFEAISASVDLADEPATDALNAISAGFVERLLGLNVGINVDIRDADEFNPSAFQVRERYSVVGANDEEAGQNLMRRGVQQPQHTTRVFSVFGFG